MSASDQPVARTTGGKIMNRSLRVGLVGGIAVASTLASVLPSAAKPLEHEHFQESFSEVTDDFCDDMTVLFEHESSTHFTAASRGKDGLIHFAANIRGTNRFTNLETGKKFTIAFTFNDKDQRVTDNGDGTLTILFKSTGNQMVYGPDGQRLFLDSGGIWFEVLVAHGGTPTDPSDDVLISESGVKASGRFDTEGRDFCADFRTLTG